MSDEPEDLVLEGGLTPEEAVELGGLLDDLFGMAVCVTVEAEVPVPGSAERLARAVRARIGEPGCRIQTDSDGLSALLGPTGLDRDDPLGALATATAALGGTWEAPVVTDTDLGQVAHASRRAEDGPDGTGTTRIHVWTGCAYAFTAYAEQEARRTPPP
ncbi:hypothetical protein ACWCYY_38315 [Kitasatospora sp. NPDC001664]